jgi:hypothetical protein
MKRMTTTLPLNAIEAAGWMSENQDVSILQ